MPAQIILQRDKVPHFGILYADEDRPFRHMLEFIPLKVDFNSTGEANPEWL